MSSTAESDAFAVGNVFQGYEILGTLTAGGMATLYLARRRGAKGFSRTTAIKVVHPHLSADEEFQQMFVDEALLLTHLVHPNIVRVEEFGEVEGRLYLAMEFVSGCSLSDLRKHLRKTGHALPVELAAYIIAHVADGLHAAHEATDENGDSIEVVHRDATPSNILLSKRGHIKLIDFGIAKSSVRVMKTVSASLKGKISYMSPEQASGELVDRRTDIYALGLVFHELLTGRKTFRGKDEFVLLKQVQNPEIELPSAVRDDIPPKLDAALMKALAPNRDDRPPTAAAFRKLLIDAVPDCLHVEASELAALVLDVPSVKSFAIPTPSHSRITTDPTAITLAADSELSVDKSRPAEPVTRSGGRQMIAYAAAGATAVIVVLLAVTLLTGGDETSANVIETPDDTTPVAIEPPETEPAVVAAAEEDAEGEAAEPPAGPQTEPVPEEEPLVTPEPETQIRRRGRSRTRPRETRPSGGETTTRPGRTVEEVRAGGMLIANDDE